MAGHMIQLDIPKTDRQTYSREETINRLAMYQATFHTVSNKSLRQIHDNLDMQNVSWEQCYIPYGGKLLRENTFENKNKIFVEKTCTNCLLVPR